ncbi:MAG: hypothetical protein ABSG91_07835 [Syntrophobacteraceae bacterium]|jgi:hypothetical protein
MKLHRKGIAVVAVAALLVVAAAVPAVAGQTIAFSQQLKTNIRSGRGVWISCGSVTLNAPAAGYVVVTASGMAWFDSYAPPTLTLTLAKTKAAKGPWIFTLTPGRLPYQTYTVRYVLQVNAGSNTFYINAESNDGDWWGSIGVQTGSLTAEWYPASAAQVSGAAQAATAREAPENANPRRN